MKNNKLKKISFQHLSVRIQRVWKSIYFSSRDHKLDLTQSWYSRSKGRMFRNPERNTTPI